jgi:hypothetical protein
MILRIPVWSVEDVCAENDWASIREMTRLLEEDRDFYEARCLEHQATGFYDGRRVWHLGDDSITSNPDYAILALEGSENTQYFTRIDAETIKVNRNGVLINLKELGASFIDGKYIVEPNTLNAFLLKFNQIGTPDDTFDAAKQALIRGALVSFSHRSGSAGDWQFIHGAYVATTFQHRVSANPNILPELKDVLPRVNIKAGNITRERVLVYHETREKIERSIGIIPEKMIGPDGATASSPVEILAQYTWEEKPGEDMKADLVDLRGRLTGKSGAVTVVLTHDWLREADKFLTPSYSSGVDLAHWQVSLLYQLLRMMNSEVGTYERKDAAESSAWILKDHRIKVKSRGWLSEGFDEIRQGFYTLGEGVIEVRLVIPAASSPVVRPTVSDFDQWQQAGVPIKIEWQSSQGIQRVNSGVVRTMIREDKNVKVWLAGQTYGIPFEAILEAGPFSSSPTAVATNAPDTGMLGLPLQPRMENGGIDFRAIPMMVQPIGNFANLTFVPPSETVLAELNLDEQESTIKAMLSKGEIPSGKMVKEYIWACYQRNEFSQRAGTVIQCLVQICRLEEQAVVDSDADLKESLMLVDAG